MSNEIQGVSPSGETCYAILLNRSGQFWNGTTFEDFDSPSYSDYDIALTEEGSTGIFQGDFPTAITTGSTYSFFVKRQAGASPAQDDAISATGKVDWTGTTTASAGSGSMTGSDFYDYVLRGGFKRTDKETEVYEETTDAIQELRERFMFDEAKADTETTDTITVLGDFKLDVESDFGMIQDMRIEDDDNGTPLIKLSNEEFDERYADINVTSDKGYPEHFTIRAGEILIGPIPDDITYVYRIAYSKRAGTVTVSTVAVPFTKEYRHVLRQLVLAKLYVIVEEYEKSSYHETKFEQLYERITSKERKNSGNPGTFNVEPFGM